MEKVNKKGRIKMINTLGKKVKKSIKKALLDAGGVLSLEASLVFPIYVFVFILIISLSIGVYKSAFISISNEDRKLLAMSPACDDENQINEKKIDNLKDLIKKYNKSKAATSDDGKLPFKKLLSKFIPSILTKPLEDRDDELIKVIDKKEIINEVNKVDFQMEVVDVLVES